MSSLGTGVDRNGSRHGGAAGIGGAMSDQGLKRKRTGGYPVQERREFRKPFQVSRSRSRGWLAPVLLGSAAALGGAVIYNRWQARDAERQYPPIGRFLDVDGVRLHYIERGQGDPLVLIHGNGTMIQDFTVSGLVDRLADRYRVIVIDRPGYGYSSRPRRLWTPYAHARLFREALAQLGVEQAVVYGHSWGTLVAMALALEFPSLVRGLVLGSGYYYPTLRADTFLFSPPAIPVIGDAMRYTVSPLVARAIRARDLSMLDVWFASLGPVASALLEAAVRAAIRRTRRGIAETPALRGREELHEACEYRRGGHPGCRMRHRRRGLRG